MKNVHQKKAGQNGFTILYAVLIASLLLSIGLGLYITSTKSELLSSSASASQLAVFAADSGLECAQYWDIKGTGSGSAFESPAGSGSTAPNPTHAGDLTGLSNTYDIAISGNYVYYSSYDNNALYIINVSNPASPFVVGTASVSDPTGVAVSGNYAYVGTWPDGISVVNVSNPASPSVIATTPTVGESSYKFAMTISGNYLYSVTDYLNVTNISNPASPVPVSSVSLGAISDGLTVSGNDVYVGVTQANLFNIYDVSNPAAPSLQSSLSLPSPAGVAVSGNYAYVNSYQNNAFFVVDVSNLAAPRLVATVNNGTGGAVLSNPWGIAVSGNYAYIASSGSNALEILNITTPTAPVQQAVLHHGSGGAMLNNPMAVVLSGGYAYLGNFTGGNLEDVNLNNVVPYTPPSSAQCGNSNIVSGWSINSTTGNDTTVFNVTYNEGSTPVCAIVSVSKTSVGGGVSTEVDSRGYNSCTVADPRRVERGLKVTY